MRRATLSKIANHQGYNATADVIDRLCTFFEVPIQDLITHVPDREG
ncbi:MAG: helix-turn-helix transcriptional regulator [Kordiimonadaceae bacterium]|nr:helix-turn-helix transcriptional regulator [Kordiimonadaceae bacterium]